MLKKEKIKENTYSGKSTFAELLVSAAQLIAIELVARRGLVAGHVLVHVVQACAAQLQHTLRACVMAVPKKIMYRLHIRTCEWAPRDQLWLIKTNEHARKLTYNTRTPRIPTHKPIMTMAI